MATILPGVRPNLFLASEPTEYPWGRRYEDLSEVRLVDLNRDGLTGLVRFSAGKTYWYRGEAQGFDPIPVVFDRPEGARFDDEVTIADVNGNGSEDIVWSTEQGLWAVDIAGSTSAGMLSRIDNGF